MLKIDNYIMIGKDDMPEELREKKSFTILIDENMIKIAQKSDVWGFIDEDLYEKIKAELNRKPDEIFENSEYIEELKR